MIKTRFDLLDLMPKSAICAEIGVQKGDFAAKILEHCQPKKMYLIDLWRHQTGCTYETDKSNVCDAEHETFLTYVKNRFNAQISTGQIEIIRDYSHAGLERIGEARLDWLYLDADHSRGAVERDLLAAEKVLRREGILAGHDYGTWPELGIEVKDVVDEFCLKRGWTMIAQTIDDPSCDGFDSYALIRKI